MFKILMVLLALCAFALQGCAMPYVTADREAQNIRLAHAITSDIPITSRATCLKRSLRAKGLDPAGLSILPDKGENITSADVLMTADMPQREFDLEMKRVLNEAGFTVHLGKMALDPRAVRYVLSVNVTAFTPLSSSVTGTEDLDLLLVGVNRERLAAQGAVRATAILYSWNDQKRDYVVWATSQSLARFYLLKDRLSGNGALKTGRATVGGGSERIEVSSVQDASILAIHDVSISAMTKALYIDC